MVSHKRSVHRIVQSKDWSLPDRNLLQLLCSQSLSWFWRGFVKHVGILVNKTMCWALLKLWFSDIFLHHVTLIFTVVDRRWRYIYTGMILQLFGWSLCHLSFNTNLVSYSTTHDVQQPVTLLLPFHLSYESPYILVKIKQTITQDMQLLMVSYGWLLKLASVNVPWLIALMWTLLRSWYCCRNVISSLNLGTYDTKVQFPALDAPLAPTPQPLGFAPAPAPSKIHLKLTWSVIKPVLRSLCSRSFIPSLQAPLKYS